MKISLKWLSDYIDVSEFFEKPEELDVLLTAAGLEVEDIKNQVEQFQGVVLGKILELQKHPNADRLTLCKIDTGESVRPVVCGAKNHKQGDMVVVALPGAVLPGNFEIKKSKIRDEVSEGMLCSETELGISDEADGIMILPADAPLGTPFAEYAKMDDVIFDLSVTPNRADCLSHWGLARELSCILNRPCKMPEIKFSDLGGKAKEVTELKLIAKDLCPRYAGRAVKGIKVGPSPAWLKSRLESVDINSINNVVDITNYVMMELGQPLHAFDADEIAGPKITIDYSKENENFKTLDGTEITLTGKELMIRDADRPVALAGVVGGLNSGTTDKTTNVFIESAHFTQQTVRKSSRYFGIDTDSAYRFARGTDPEGVILAMDRACQLIQELAGGTVTKDFYDLYPEPLKHNPINIKMSYLEERLGYEPDADEFKEWMKRLGCDLKVIKKREEFEVLPPAFRWDLSADVDLVEEYARLHGYDKIPETMPPHTDEPTYHDVIYENENRLADLLNSAGYLQALNYNFISEVFQSDFLYGKDRKAFETRDSNRYTGLGVDLVVEAVKVVNPLSDELNVMRTSLVPGLIKNLLHNYRHGSYYGRVFETGHAFSKKDGEYCQSDNMAMLAWGQREDLWNKDIERPVIYDLKASLENVISKLKGSTFQWRGIRAEDQLPFLHPGQSATLFYEGRVVGYIGTLHPVLKNEYKLRHDVAVGEFNVKSLMRGQPRDPKAQKISKFPAVERDIAFVVPDGMLAGDLAREIKKVGGPLLQSVDVFDVFKGKGVPKAHSSIAFRMLYQDQEGTLSEEQLTKLQKDLIETMSSKFEIKTR